MTTPLTSHRETSIPPDVLRLQPDGTLTCADGSDVKERLRLLFEGIKRPHETEIPVVVMGREGIQILYRDAFLGLNSVA